MMKFVPFSIFLIIPGLELLLPPFLVIFPNSVPSQFMSKEARVEKFKTISERRDKAAIYLNQNVPKYFYQLEKDD
jgi:LETM1 and EF-hand domain-containing protein 1